MFWKLAWIFSPRQIEIITIVFQATITFGQFYLGYFWNPCSLPLLSLHCPGLGNSKLLAGLHALPDGLSCCNPRIPMAPPSLTISYLFSITVYHYTPNSWRVETAILSGLPASRTMPGTKRILNNHVLNNWMVGCGVPGTRWWLTRGFSFNPTPSSVWYEVPLLAPFYK